MARKAQGWAIGWAIVVVVLVWGCGIDRLDLVPYVAAIAGGLVLLVTPKVARGATAGALAGTAFYGAVLGWTGSPAAIDPLLIALLLPLAAHGGALLARKLETERWGATGVVTVLCTSLVVIGSYVAIVRLTSRVHGTAYSDAWLGAAGLGLLLGFLSLFASVLPWRALRRVALARGGRVDDLGHLVLFDGTEGRSDLQEPGEVIAWPKRAGFRGGYREDAGPPRFEVFAGDRGEYVDIVRRRAMRVHLAGLALLWLFGAPLVAARLGGWL